MRLVRHHKVSSSIQIPLPNDTVNFLEAYFAYNLFTFFCYIMERFHQLHHTGCCFSLMCCTIGGNENLYCATLRKNEPDTATVGTSKENGCLHAFSWNGNWLISWERDRGLIYSSYFSSTYDDLYFWIMVLPNDHVFAELGDFFFKYFSSKYDKLRYSKKKKSTKFHENVIG